MTIEWTDNDGKSGLKNCVCFRGVMDAMREDESQGYNIALDFCDDEPGHEVIEVTIQLASDDCYATFNFSMWVHEAEEVATILTEGIKRLKTMRLTVVK